jgi:hypothetical protein
MANIPIVPHLQTFSFVVPEATVVVLPEDKHRTFFALSKAIDRKDDVTHVWIGVQPPLDQRAWITLSADTSISLTFPNGVYGPISIAVDGLGDGSVLIISNLAEDKHASAIEIKVPLWDTVPNHRWTRNVDTEFSMDMNDFILEGKPILEWSTTVGTITPRTGPDTGGILTIPYDSAVADYPITVTAFNTESIGGVPSNEFTWSVAEAMLGSSLRSTAAIQDGAIVDISYAVQGDSLRSTGTIQDGALTSVAYALSGDSLRSTGLIQDGEVFKSSDLQGDNLHSTGVIQDGELTGVSYSLQGDGLNSTGGISDGNVSGLPVWKQPEDETSEIGSGLQTKDMRDDVTSDAGTLDTWAFDTSETDPAASGFTIDPITGIISVTPDT